MQGVSAPVAAGLISWAVGASGLVSFDSCREASFRHPDGSIQGLPPCGSWVRGVAVVGTRRLFVCSGGNATLCDGDGSGSTVTCGGLTQMGCPGDSIRDAVLSSTLTSAYAACATEAVRCDWNATAGTASNCGTVVGARCPTAGMFAGTVHGIGLLPGNDNTLVLSCSAQFTQLPAGVFTCPLAPGGARVLGYCSRADVLPCETPSSSGVGYDNSQRGITFDSTGQLVVACDVDQYAYCDWTPGRGPTTCARPFGQSPCLTAYSRWTSKISELPSGLTGIACGSHWLLCGTANPSVSPTGVPTAPGIPSAPPAAQPTRQPVNRPTMPPTVRPTAAPSVLPTREPSMGPSTAVPTVAPSAVSRSSPPSPTPARARTAAPIASPTVPTTLSVTPGPRSSTSAPHGSDSECPPAPGCEALRCLAAGACREAGGCYVGHRGVPRCGPGPAAADGSACAEDTGSCVGGICAVVPAQCARGNTCATLGDAVQCQMVVCAASGECVTELADDGQECDDGNDSTAQDACLGGRCVGVDLCLGVRCEAGDCRSAGACRPSDGACEGEAAPDGTPCAGAAHPVAERECVAGECRTFAAMRFAELALVPRGSSQAPVAVFTPETPLAPARAACRAADGGPAGWTDTRVALIGELPLGEGAVELAALGVQTFGDLIYLFAEPVALRSVEVTAAPAAPHQAPVRLDVAGCVPAPDAQRLRLLGPLCGAGAQEGTLGGYVAAVEDLRWASLPISAGAAAGSSRSFVINTTDSDLHQCYRVRPVQLAGGCGTSCPHESSTIPIVGSAEGRALLLVAAGAIGLLVGFVIGCRSAADATEEPPPLTGKDESEVRERCRDALILLAMRWRRCGSGLFDELAAKMRAPRGVHTQAALRAMLAQPWRDAALRHPQLGRLPEMAQLTLRLYTLEPQDVDREMGWADAPPPGVKTAGHGIHTALDPAAVATAWAKYCKVHDDIGGSRNESPYRVMNRACFRLCGTLRPSSLDGVGGSLRYLAALTWATASSRPGAASSGPFRLVRMLGNLPAATRDGYSALRSGQCFALPCPSSCSAAARADGEFMGDHPAYAVVLHLHFVPETAVGADLSPLSMYPEEAEVLLPPFTVFRVRRLWRPRVLHRVVSLEAADGLGPRARRLLLHLRALARPLLVVEADCIGPLRPDAEAARWFTEVARDAASPLPPDAPSPRPLQPLPLRHLMPQPVSPREQHPAAPLLPPPLPLRTQPLAAPRPAACCGRPGGETVPVLL
eukprot:TRINITY_DN12451_c0_g2_i1.p1 TRINITY_DN12451_c0_g2~~TRINITY_DN12451_c0_g2_i1.p1  ORF type:complete len:1248 (+),score=100.33 TRINITY_DN12451_c0_g2_i1:144-3887(+)